MRLDRSGILPQETKALWAVHPGPRKRADTALIALEHSLTPRLLNEQEQQGLIAGDCDCGK